MLYKEKYHVKTRFQKSANIASDDNLADFLDNYIVVPSASNTILSIINGIKYGQGAFTLTGAYGGGKSSLCLFFMALLGDDTKVRSKAIRKISEEQNDDFNEQIKSLEGGFFNIPITAREAAPTEILSEALQCNSHPGSILKEIEKLRKKHGRVNIIIDEMGKILEANQDPFFLQTLAEYCNRTNGEVNFIGCLHAAFSEYARGKAKHVVEEWRKIQGRFLDIPVNTFQEEQITLIGSAIESSANLKIPEAVSNFIKQKSGSNAKENKVEEYLLSSTCPLHPATTLMLAKYANSEISQSNRGVFTFLSSPEAYGFQEFLKSETIKKNNFYKPNRLYDYFTANLRNTIVASGAAGTFATAEEILKDITDINKEAAIKTICLWQIFQPHSQIAMTEQTLNAVYPELNMKKALKALEEAQHIRKADKKRGYIVSETSELDLAEAKKSVQSEYSIQELSSFDSPYYIDTIIGKKHLFNKGTIRTMDIILAHANDINLTSERPDKIGNFILILPRDADEEKKANEVSKNDSERNFYSVVKDYETIAKINKEVHTLEKIAKEHSLLKYDKIARNIVQSLIEKEQEMLELEIDRALFTANWYYDGKNLGALNMKDYSQKCSELADKIFSESPIIISELLNKNKVDLGGASGLRKLLMAMADNADKPRLGLEGYSAAASLYDILLDNSGIHDSTRVDDFYVMPEAKDPSNIRPLWENTTSRLIKNRHIISLPDIYDFWGAAPYGVKSGLKPILMLAYILAHSKNIAKYIKVGEYEFHTEFDEFFCDMLYRRPHEIGLKFVTEEQKRSPHIKKLYETALTAEAIPTPNKDEILDIAASYKQFINNLPKCTKTTDNLSIEARAFRNAIRNTEDPNKMLNSDIKGACSANDIPRIVKEISEYYLKRLLKIGTHIDAQLDITAKANGELIERSAKVYNYATEPDIKMLSQHIQIKDPQNRTKKIIQMATGRSPEEWTDQVLNSSIIFIDGHIDEFLRIERKIRLQSREHALICVRENGRYREIEVLRDAAVEELLNQGKEVKDG